MYKIFDFVCQNCGNTEERLIEDKEEQHIHCSVCKGKLKRIMASPAFHLKGNCWAKDNYGLKEKK